MVLGVRPIDTGPVGYERQCLSKPTSRLLLGVYLCSGAWRNQFCRIDAQLHTGALPHNLTRKPRRPICDRTVAPDTALVKSRAAFPLGSSPARSWAPSCGPARGLRRQPDRPGGTRCWVSHPCRQKCKSSGLASEVFSEGTAGQQRVPHCCEQGRQVCHQFKALFYRSPFFVQIRCEWHRLMRDRCSIHRRHALHFYTHNLTVA